MVFHQFSCMIGNISSTDDGNLVVNVNMDPTPVEEKKFLSHLDRHLNRGDPNQVMTPNEKSDNLTRVAGFGVGVGRYSPKQFVSTLAAILTKIYCLWSVKKMSVKTRSNLNLYLQETLGYPFLVLRRQCQVNQTGMKYHILPFSLFPVINKIHQRQGASVFWKGWGSSCIVKGVTIATEIFIFELFQIPRDQNENKDQIGWKRTIAHDFLKGFSLLLTLPLFSASMIDSVQTAVLDQPRSMFSFLKDAAYRTIGLYSSRGHGRLLPVYSLVLPSIMYGIIRYSVKTFIASCVTKLYFTKKLQKNSHSSMEEGNMNMIYYTELASNFLSSLLTEILMYPLDTCMLRLHLQGTRTIIDDTDKGFGVVPLCTTYTDLKDCIHEVHRQEGMSGFYKGFGALMLQYFVHFMILKSTKILYRS